MSKAREWVIVNFLILVFNSYQQKKHHNYLILTSSIVCCQLSCTRVLIIGLCDSAEQQNRIMDLHGEVMACGYEDVQVMWSILDKSKSTACNITSSWHKSAFFPFFFHLPRKKNIYIHTKKGSTQAISICFSMLMY